jgi:methylmalonyl-CoA/ethylmalonyl-CoA epimerase
METSEMTAITPTVHFDTIGQIALTVSDIARSKDFYQNTLGMKFLFDAGSMAFFQCGDIRFMIGTSPEPFQAQSPHGGTLLYFKVSDIHQAHEFLKEKGVVFHQRPHLVAKMPDHELWLAFIKDPDENILGVMSEIPLD